MNKRQPKRDDGFVLAELIVAIALLALVSGTILQLFLVASTSNRNARDLDSASSRAVSVMERLRVLDESGYAADSLLSSAKITADESSTQIVIAYDYDWNETQQDGNESFVLMASVRDAREQEELIDTFGTDGGEMMRAAYREIDVKVEALRINNETGDESWETLLDFSSGKYITKEAAA